jgi:hypothetical protein
MERREEAKATRLPLEVIAPSPEPGLLRAIVFLALAAVGFALVWLIPHVPMLARVAAALLIGALGPLALSRRKRGTSRVTVGWLSLAERGIERIDGGGKRSIVRFGEPFGLTVLANETRARAILAFTTPDHTRYVHVRMGSESTMDSPPLSGEAIDDGGVLARAVTVADGDLQGDERVALGLFEAGKVVRAVSAKSPAAFDRIYLPDSSGGGIVLDGPSLRVDDCTFDLLAPLEWRGFMFHESGPLGSLGGSHAAGGVAATIYQGTWIRQGGVEAVLVAPMPAELSQIAAGSVAPPPGSSQDMPSQRAIVRDLRLMQSLPDSPPPRELRVAIERLFMVPIRRALDRAPRVSRPTIPSRGGQQSVQT